MVVSIDDLEPDYATACCAAFNNWLADYCQTNPRRLKPAAIVSLHDPELAAAEARRAVEHKGHVGVILLPMPVNGRYFNAPECDVLWAGNLSFERAAGLPRHQRRGVQGLRQQPFSGPSQLSDSQPLVGLSRWS